LISKLKKDLLNNTQEINRITEEVKQEEVKQEEVKQEEVKQEEVKQEEVKQEEVKSELVKPEEIKLETTSNAVKENDNKSNSKIDFILCVTHNGRLKQLISSFIKLIKPVKVDKNYLTLVKNTKSFQNCAIVHITPTFIEVLNNDKSDVYYKYDKEYSLLNGKEIVFVRHGQGTHNLNKSTFAKLSHFFEKDPKLTPLGIEQAKKAGSIIINKIIDNRSNLNFIFTSSELSRTQQTISEIIPYITNNIVIPIYIVNCIFEIGDIPGTALVPENTSTCNRKSYMNHTEKNNCNEVKNSSGVLYKLKWLSTNQYNCGSDAFSSLLYDVNLILQGDMQIIN